MSLTAVRRSVRLDVLPVSGSVPTRFRLFKFGPNKTTKGTFTLTPDGAAAIVAEALEHGADLAIDYNHAMVDESSADPALAGRAAGWFRLDVGFDGLYADSVSWTPEGSEMVRSRQYRYISPAFYVDDDGEITSIINCAITNIPATYGLTPLVASAAKDAYSMDLITLSAADIREHAKALRELADSTDSAKLRKIAEKLGRLADVDDAQKPADGEDKSDKPAPKPAPAPDAAPADQGSIPAESDKNDAIKQALSMLALSREAGEKTETAPLSEEAAIAAIAREVTGKHTAGEIRGTLLALGQGKDSVHLLQNRVADLESKLRKADVSEVVRLATKAGKLRPSQREWAVKLGMVDPESLRAFIEESVSVQTEANAPTHSDEAAKLTSVQLSQDEEKMLRVTGVDRAAYLARKSGAKSLLLSSLGAYYGRSYKGAGYGQMGPRLRNGDDPRRGRGRRENFRWRNG